MKWVSVHRRSFSRPAAWLAVGLAVAGIFWLALRLAALGPGPAAGPLPERPRALSHEDRAAAAELSRLEEHYRKVEAAGTVSADWEQRLERAAARQQAILTANRYAGTEHTERLERLEIARDTLMAARLYPRSQELEAAAAGLSDPGGELGRLREAHKLQQEINRSRAAPRFKDFARETRLALRIEAVQAGPLRRQADEILQLAGEAGEREDWPGALQALVRARAVLTELNREFPRSAFADRRLQARVEEQIAGLEPAVAAAEIAARERGGDEAATAGRTEIAAEFYREARARQLELNARFGRSRFASAVRLEELETKRQTVLAAEARARAAILDEELGELLRQRRLVAAARALAALTVLLDEMETDYPRRPVDDGVMRLRAGYLARQWPGLAALQERCYGLLRPLPGSRGLLLAGGEVPQDLFVQVMNTNPSRHVGADLPVDSVDWFAAVEFCRRLSWLLGRTVRLPDEEEFKRALAWSEGEPWLADRSDGRPRAAAKGHETAAGFADLLGNVAEWLVAAPEAVTAVVAGGGHEDPAATAPDRWPERPKTTRSPQTGFRFLVEHPLD
jgi:hypothetical protein